MRKFLILLTDAGSGHRSAANALKKAVELTVPDQFEVEIQDILKLLAVPPYDSGDQLYSRISKNAVLEYFHNKLFSIVNGDIGFEIMSEELIKKLYKGFEKFILSKTPEYILSVHPTVSILLSEFKKRNPKFKTATIITDLVTLNRGWADLSSDLVFSPTKEAVSLLAAFGVKPEKIKFPLFPINPDIRLFNKDKDSVLKEINLDPEKFTIFFTSGGLGTIKLLGSIIKIAADPAKQIIIAAGKDEKLRNMILTKLAQYKNTVVLGFLNNIQDYYNAADIIIGKPGPATILETSLFKKKMLITEKIGIQEQGNINYALNSINFVYVGANSKKLLKEIKADENKRDEGLGRDWNESLQIIEEVLKIA